MKTLEGFGSLLLAATIVSTLSAETRCPGNHAGVPLRFANGYQMIVAVSVMHSGPYNFLLDTGTQFSMIDPSLASELHLLASQDSVPVDGTGFHTTASTTQLDQLEVGSHAVAHLEVVVYGLQNLKSIDLQVRGILGEDFLQHFDMLIDNAHKMLCLDDSGALRAEVKGAHIPLLTAPQADVPPNSLVFAVRLSEARRPLHLKLDSGANAPFLYSAPQYMAVAQFRGASLHGSGTNGLQRAFVALPAQNMKIGSLDLEKVPFFTPIGGQKNARTSDVDGLLTMGLFRRVFICHAEHFAVLEAR